MPVVKASPSVYLRLIAHLRSIVGVRDRSSLNKALMLAGQALFDSARVSLMRIVRQGGGRFFITDATSIDGHQQVNNAYVTSPRHGHPLEGHPFYLQCCDTGAPVFHQEEGRHHYIHPLLRRDQVYALLELETPEPLGAEELLLLEQLVALFLDHLSLIDYAETDTLTGLLNRKTFDENLGRILANAEVEDEAGDFHSRRHARRSGGGNWLAVADIDHFKRVNDTFGHIIGDEVLLLVAQLMRKSFRFDDQLFRFGGEEFVTVLQPATEPDACAVLERFRSAIEQHVFPLVGQVTISIGFTHIDIMDTPTEVLGRADQALYYAKEHGRNRVENYELLEAAGRISGPKAANSGVELF